MWFDKMRGFGVLKTRPEPMRIDKMRGFEGSKTRPEPMRIGKNRDFWGPGGPKIEGSDLIKSGVRKITSTTVRGVGSNRVLFSILIPRTRTNSPSGDPQKRGGKKKFDDRGVMTFSPRRWLFYPSTRQFCTCLAIRIRKIHPIGIKLRVSGVQNRVLRGVPPSSDRCDWFRGPKKWPKVVSEGFWGVKTRPEPMWLGPNRPKYQKIPFFSRMGSKISLKIEFLSGNWGFWRSEGQKNGQNWVEGG